MASPYISIPNLSIHPGKINLWNQVELMPVMKKAVEVETDSFVKPVINHVQLDLFREQIQNSISIFSNELPVLNPKKSISYEHLLKSKRTAHGRVSNTAKRKINKALDYLLYVTVGQKVHNMCTGRSVKMRVVFVTLTLPSKQVHTDNEIKKECLNQFLIELKKKFGVKYYLWRAEKQLNGNIHFHIICDRFIGFQELRDRWNRIIEKLGYVSRYRQSQIDWHQNGFRPRLELRKTWSVQKQYEAYQRGAKGHWNSPNSTDIHSIRKIHDIRNYVSKYVTKQEKKKLSFAGGNFNINDETGEINFNASNKKSRKEIRLRLRRSQLKLKKLVQQGRIWGCSQNLMNLKGARTVIDSDIQTELNDLVRQKDVKYINELYYQVIIFPPELLRRMSNTRLFKLFSQYLLDKFEFSDQLFINI